MQEPEDPLDAPRPGRGLRATGAAGDAAQNPLARRRGAVALAVSYFATVFAAGFALALVRIPLLVPHLGVRAAELLEMPFMLLVIAWASRRVQRRAAPLGAPSLVIGALALLLMVLAELGLAWGLSRQSPLAYLAARDPVSGPVYALSLLVFALAPWLWSRRRAG